MENYSVIADAGAELLKILRTGLVPELIPDMHGIGLASPADRGDLQLGVWLYDIKEDGELRVNGMQNSGQDRLKYPPLYLSLFYMVTAYSGSDIKFRAVQEQRILGRAIQVLYDNSRISASALGGEAGTPDLRIERLDLEVREQREIWNLTELPYRTSLFYRVVPVVLESGRSRKISRVTEIDMRIEEKERG